MQKELPAIQKAGVQVVGISYDSADTLKSFADRQKITFPLLSDPDSKTITAYALKNQEMVGKSYGKFDLDGIPYPGTLLIDRDGIVRAKLFKDGYKLRHSVDELTQEAEKLRK